MADPVGPVPATIDEVSLVGEATPSFEAFYENTHARLYTALCLVTGSRPRLRSSGIYTVNVDGTDLHQVTAVEDPQTPDWGPAPA
jgi:hypothetical protein